MSDRPRLLDLFCGAGGAAVGYHRAGFDVTGVDILPQPRYPFTFIQGDALEHVAAHGHEYDAIHASPPCQRYSRGRKQSHTGHLHPDLIAATRDALRATGRPHVIENVADSRRVLRAVLLLCGGMFPGVQTYRHRLFESSHLIPSLPHPPHVVKSPRSNVYVEGQFMTIYGHVSPVDKAREVMGIDWAMSQAEVANAIPPAYTEHIGRTLLAALRIEAA
jgi:DNA (cytosine-5)-methyltransferase 1